MSKPSALPDRVTVIQKLFSELPNTVSRDPVSVPVFSIYLLNPSSASDTVSFFIYNGILLVNSLTNYIDTETIKLYDISLEDLQNYFNRKYGYQGIHVTLMPDQTLYSGLLSSVLLEGAYTISSTPIQIDRFTSNNFALLQALAITLDQQDQNKNAALAQTDLRAARGKWLDYWGNFFGSNRNGLELDNDNLYRSRLQWEAAGLTSTNLAIENLLYAAIGRNCFVKDGGQPFTFSGSYGYAYGNANPVLGSSSFYMQPTGTSPFIVGQNIDSGVAAIFVGNISGTDGTPSSFTTLNVTSVSFGAVAVGQSLTWPGIAGTCTIVSGSGSTFTVTPAAQISSRTMTARAVPQNATLTAIPSTGGSSAGTYSISSSAFSTSAVTITSATARQGSYLATNGYVLPIFGGQISVTSFTGTISSSSLNTLVVSSISGSLSIGRTVVFNVSSVQYSYKICGMASGTTGGNGTYYLSTSAPAAVSSTAMTSTMLTVPKSSISAGSFSSGLPYVITKIGTTSFTAIGASSNTIGASFFATGAGSGTGTALPIIYGSLIAGMTIAFTYSSTAYSYTISSIFSESDTSNTYGLIAQSGTTPTAVATTTKMTASIPALSSIADPHGWSAYTNSYTIGPNAGTGSFITFVQLAEGETSLPYSISSYVATLVNKWKPAGVPFVVQSY